MIRSVRKLNGMKERMEAHRLIITSFLHEWEEEEAREEARDPQEEV